MFQFHCGFYKISPSPLRIYQLLNYSTAAASVKYKKYYEILEISENSDQEQIRMAYLHLVKKYHPDNPEGDLRKFQEVDEAFRVLTQKKSRERWDVEERFQERAEEFDIRHTAPQHRQYLSYDGIGTGTPFQRQKQYAKFRAMQAADNVLSHRIAKVTAEEKALMDKKIPVKHKIKTKYGFDRLVEDLIQESMSKGEFNNLPGCGKPLKQHQNLNPYVDYVTHKINQVLIDNGFTPEWITLQKEIREEINVLRSGLATARSYLGPHPFQDKDTSEWETIIATYTTITNNINKKINKFNLVVPVLNKQMLHVSLEREASDVVINGEHSRKFSEIDEAHKDCDRGNNIVTIFSIFDGMFRK